MPIRSSALWEKLRNKRYREAFVADATRRAIPFQIRALMRAKGVSQKELAERSGLTQGVISRVANPAYGKLTLNTIIRVAAGFDVAFVGRFVPFSKLHEYVGNLSDEALVNVPSFEEEDARDAAEEALAKLMTRLNAMPLDPGGDRARQLGAGTGVQQQPARNRREQLLNTVKPQPIKASFPIGGTPPGIVESHNADASRVGRQQQHA